MTDGLHCSCGQRDGWMLETDASSDWHGWWVCNVCRRPARMALETKLAEMGFYEEAAG